MKTKLIKLALSFFSSDDGRKFVRNVAVVIISPFVAITVLIGAIFSDGISFNHNLVTDLFEGNPISELTGEMKQYVQEIQDGLVLIDSHIDKINQTFTNGSSLNIYQVKGYFIGYMVSSQHKVFSDEMAEAWVNSFTEGEEVKVPTSVNAVIYASLEKNLNEKLLKDTKKSIETCYGALIGNANGIVKAEGFSSQVVDTTGAGDSFWGGFTASFLQSETEPEHLTRGQMVEFGRVGNAVASLCVEHRGGISAIPEMKEIKVRLGK